MGESITIVSKHLLSGMILQVIFGAPILFAKKSTDCGADANGQMRIFEGDVDGTNLRPA